MPRMIVVLILLLLPFYLIGAIPTGQLLARARGVDLSQHGSGNVGATNALRVLGKRAGVLTLSGDVAKGALAVMLARLINNSSGYLALVAFVTVAGHCFSIPGKLKGGKGVATALGVLGSLLPGATAFALLVFVIILWLSKLVSLSSVSAVLALPIAAMVLAAPDDLVYGAVCIALLVTYRHKANLQRIIEGREEKISVNIFR